MAVDQETVRRIARLARIRLEEADVPILEAELNAILRWIEQLNEVDVTGVEPLTAVVETRMKMREDVVTDGADPAAVLANAPAESARYFSVPKVVE
jgi:aspartyl-tRNA(Asn)/glutamyl-tRNA(Gln) amidotransferase subunit C